MVKNNENSIIVECLSKKFGDFYAVNSISFTVRKGEIFGFLGGNGAGKTTAMKILCGLSKPTSGKVLVNGCDVYKETEKLKKSIGYMSQKFSLYQDLTVIQNINFFSGIYGLRPEQIRSETQKLLKELNLEESKNKQVKSLPLGWKQKLSFYIAVIHNPPLVFLDEPTGGVDPITRREFWEMIYKKASEGTTFFITTHYMDEAEYCNRISIMVDGKIAELGTPQSLKEKYKLDDFDAVFHKVIRST